MLAAHGGLHIDAIEVIWIVLVTEALTASLHAIWELKREREAVARQIGERGGEPLEEAAREQARANFIQELVRGSQMFLFLLMAIPALFVPDRVAISERFADPVIVILFTLPAAMRFNTWRGTRARRRVRELVMRDLRKNQPDEPMQDMRQKNRVEEPHNGDTG